MSTELKRYASVMPATPTTPFTNVANLHLTRFSGGHEGAKLLITMNTEVDQFGHTHIHLNQTQIKDLINTLQEAFDLTDVPDCDQDEEMLSNCCGSEPWDGNESLCGQCFEHADFV